MALEALLKRDAGFDLGRRGAGKSKLRMMNGGQEDDLEAEMAALAPNLRDALTIATPPFVDVSTDLDSWTIIPLAH